MSIKKENYSGIDWLRTIGCIGIALMHIKANSFYDINNWFYNIFISYLTDFVYVFMAISAFVMCINYYDSVMHGKINWTEFYIKRYMRILPFFMFLIIVDNILNHNISSLIESITELTLLHGFIPQELSVIGVGWYLGTVFVFYLIFPFFCVLITNKRMAWISFGISIILHYICDSYFNLNRHNIIFSLCYFLVGGLVFLYKEYIIKIKWYIWTPLLIITLIIYYIINSELRILIFVFTVLSVAIINSNSHNKIVSLISKISMEIYLSHMVIFRVIEKLSLNSIIGNGMKQYLCTAIITIMGTICFAYVSHMLFQIIIQKAIIKLPNNNN